MPFKIKNTILRPATSNTKHFFLPISKHILYCIKISSCNLKIFTFLEKKKNILFLVKFRTDSLHKIHHSPKVLIILYSIAWYSVAMNMHKLQYKPHVVSLGFDILRHIKPKSISLNRFPAWVHLSVSCREKHTYFANNCSIKFHLLRSDGILSVFTLHMRQAYEQTTSP